jgi:hypothetical protein
MFVQLPFCLVRARRDLLASTAQPHLLTVIIGKRCVEGEIANNREFSLMVFCDNYDSLIFRCLTVPLAQI